MSSIDYLNLCRLCLVKESAFVPIFDGEGDSRQIFHKIAACLPVKVTRDDKLPKKICNECVQKIELFYQFCNTTTNAEKQLLEWIGGVDLNDKQTYVSAVINQDQSSNNRLDGNVMQQTNEQHQNNIDMNMMESIGLEMPMMIQQNQTQMTINYTNNTNAQSMQSNTIAQQQNNSKNMEESDDDHCGGDDDMGQNEELSVKEEIQDSNRTIEPTFVSVSSPCEEAGPSGLQQKSGDIPDGQFLAGQSTDGDPKSGKRKRGQPLSASKPSAMVIIHVPDLEKGRKKKSNRNDDRLENTIIINKNKKSLRSSCTKKKSKIPENNENMTKEEPIDIDDDDDLEIINERRIMPNRKSSLTVKKIKKISDKNSDDRRDDSESSEDSSSDDDADSDDVWEPEENQKDKEKVKKIHKNKKTYECTLCDITFELSKRYKQHMYRHYKSKTFECEYCHKKFKTHAIIKSHMKNQHSETRIYYCDQCPFETKYASTITTHKNRKHRTNNEPQFSCDYCKKKFFMKADWDTHIKNIHESGPQTCEICGLICPSRNSLIGHKNYRHKEKKFPCTKCNRKLTTAENLAAHIKQHDLTFVCEICGMQFKKKNGLKKHESVHMGKTFTCTFDGCDKKFTTIMTLRVHLLTHKGVKPYSCNVCPKTFTQRSSLMHHWKKAHHDAAVPPPSVPLKHIVNT